MGRSDAIGLWLYLIVASEALPEDMTATEQAVAGCSTLVAVVRALAGLRVYLLNLVDPDSCIIWNWLIPSSCCARLAEFLEFVSR